MKPTAEEYLRKIEGCEKGRPVTHNRVIYLMECYAQAVLDDYIKPTELVMIQPSDAVLSSLKKCSEIEKEIADYYRKCNLN